MQEDGPPGVLDETLSQNKKAKKVQRAEQMVVLGVTLPENTNKTKMSSAFQMFHFWTSASSEGGGKMHSTAKDIIMR